ncbi:DUF898 domain-containing protein [Cognatishimia sp. F0-27]|uniref:DUF898 domain-containing protein n=1 Tax=Cognatishimia sp. F0-27 TaxID=2816855 RepID=UPI001D0CABF8|nr:DUF898 domain-containing protein [Cognatishimia sp. F0-27]
MTQDTPSENLPGPWSRARGLDHEEAAPRPAPAPGFGERLTGDDPDVLRTSFIGRRLRLFWLVLKSGFLTVLTLGIYRFWMKTRIRRWFWSAIRPGGHPLEYVGDPFEKLLGFLFAVVILAFYIGIVNLLLMFVSFAVLNGNVAAYILSFVGVIPLWFFAQYRARRYVLARTRWRGLRFGLEPGAWGYAFRALGYWALTLLSGGLLWPLMTFRLEQYKSDRTFFGAARLRQGGRWTMLYGAMKPLFLGAGLGLAAAGMIALGFAGWGSTIALCAGLTLFYGLFHYRVESLKRLTATKRLAGARLELQARPWRILWITVFGYGLTALALLVPMVAIGIALSAMLGESVMTLSPQDLSLNDLGGAVLIALSLMLYFGVFLMWSAASHALVTVPTLQHYASGLVIRGAESLNGVHQRARDAHTEAEGFADALDVGASL